MSYLKRKIRSEAESRERQQLIDERNRLQNQQMTSERIQQAGSAYLDWRKQNIADYQKANESALLRPDQLEAAGIQAGTPLFTQVQDPSLLQKITGRTYEANPEAIKSISKQDSGHLEKIQGAYGDRSKDAISAVGKELRPDVPIAESTFDEEWGDIDLESGHTGGDYVSSQFDPSITKGALYDDSNYTGDIPDLNTLYNQGVDQVQADRRSAIEELPDTKKMEFRKKEGIDDVIGGMTKNTQDSHKNIGGALDKAGDVIGAVGTVKNVGTLLGDGTKEEKEAAGKGLALDAGQKILKSNLVKDTAQKVVGKNLLDKTAGKLIPGLSIVSGAKNLFSDKTNFMGKLSGLGQIASGALKFIPGVGTAASAILDTATTAVDLANTGSQMLPSKDQGSGGETAFDMYNARKHSKKFSTDMKKESDRRLFGKR